VRPRDAVQWALYYPPVIAPQVKFAEARAFYREGKIRQKKQKGPG